MQNVYDIIEIVGKKKILVLLQGKVDIKLQMYMKIIRRRNCISAYKSWKFQIVKINCYVGVNIIPSNW